MRVLLVSLVLLLAAAPAGAQPRVEFLFGVDRNVDSGPAETDGWIGASVEWTVRPGLEVGIGTDHHFEEAPRPAEYEDLAIFLSARRSFGSGPLRPFLRVGIGVGRASCEGDVCREGAHLRASGGARGDLGGRLELAAEAGISRVSRPFAGVGVAFRVGRPTR